MAETPFRRNFTRARAQNLAEVFRDMACASGGAASFNNACIFRAWREISGLKDYTLSLFFRDGVLTVTLSSAAVRSGLRGREEAMLERLNAFLDADPLFIKGHPACRRPEKIVLK